MFICSETFVCVPCLKRVMYICDCVCRMKRLCHLYVEEYDEEEIYRAHRRQPLTDFLCRSPDVPGLTDVCLAKKKAKPGKLEL